MTHDPTISATGEDSTLNEKFNRASETNKLVRVLRSIIVSPERGRSIDDRVVQFKYYNAFNYSLLSRDHETLNLTMGITSANPGEGKTLVACNLAVSLAMGSQKKTILVDLNVQNPQLHRVFGVPQVPGLMDAFRDGTIHISESAIDHLSILTAGIPALTADQHATTLPDQVRHGERQPTPMLGLEQLTAFRDIVYTLEQEFDFIIVDMPAIRGTNVPVLFANQLNGLLVVVDSSRTRREEIDAMFRSINKNQVLGFVYNRYQDPNGR
jgi:Mrp family chromosome partitioning ATPase